ncbi:MAG: hypothetical protein ACRDD7_13025 [Peptostreptococcaceae bacterium]
MVEKFFSNKSTLIINGTTYEGTLDMQVLFNTQKNLKSKGKEISIPDMFISICNKDLLVCTELAINAVIRCSDISINEFISELFVDDSSDEDAILEKIEEIFSFALNLIILNFPKNDCVGIESCISISFGSPNPNTDWSFENMRDYWENSLNLKEDYWYISPLVYVSTLRFYHDNESYVIHNKSNLREEVVNNCIFSLRG